MVNKAKAKLASLITIDRGTEMKPLERLEAKLSKQKSDPRLAHLDAKMKEMQKRKRRWNKR